MAPEAFVQEVHYNSLVHLKGWWKTDTGRTVFCKVLESSLSYINVSSLTRK